MFKMLVVGFVLAMSFQLSSQTFNFNHNGLTRQYVYYAPDNLPGNAPLVFVLHGYSGSANSIRDYTQMNEIANDENFAVCYPQGTKDEWGNRFWQVGYEFHEPESVDDVGFICDLASYLYDEYNLSRQNTFVTGMSNGGDMSFLLSCQANHIFKAFAPVCGTIMNNRFGYCNSPVPVFAINGDNDNTTWFNGDPDNIGEWGAYLGLPEIVDRFVAINECVDKISEDLPNTNTNDGSKIKFERYYNGIDKNEVWFYRVINGGHDWPGASGNMDINASEEIWKFFSRYLNNETTSITNNMDRHIFKIYPNPNNGSDIYFSTTVDSPNIIRVISASGNIVLSKTLKGNNHHKLDLNNKLPEGIYSIQVISDNSILNRKLVISQ